LALSLVLGILPLLGVAWTLVNGMITTVDGLFMSLILLTLSAVFMLNAYWEGSARKSPWRRRRNLPQRKRVNFVATQTTVLSRPLAPASAGVLLPAFTLWWRESVRFYRSKSRVVGVLASPLVFW